MHYRRCRYTSWLASIWLLWGLSPPVAAQDFNRDIRPLLSDRCFKCHGPDESSNDSGLRLDVRQEAHHAAFVPGDIGASAAIERIQSDDPDFKMPPPDSHLQLTQAEIQLLCEWVNRGAVYDQHWAFKSLPQKISDGSRECIDDFVRVELDKRGLRPAPPAERWRWLRRVTFDLTGLPPTPDEIEAFECDHSSSAFEGVVDRLLSSPAFGEHQAVSWLDASRYADSYGYQSDRLSPTWPWRDWVVRALNENLPYDQFLTWQLAGDLLPDATTEQILATGFNRLHRQTNEGGSVELEWRTEYAADRVHTFGTAMLGMTLECARCHDHKFDPVSQRDYYNLFAFFNSIDEWGMYNDSARVPTPSLLLPTAEQKRELNRLSAELESARRERAEFAVELEKRFDRWLSNNKHIRFDPVLFQNQTMIEYGRLDFWPLDNIDEKGNSPNLIEGRQPARTSAANQLVDGFRGQALLLTGDDAVEFPVDQHWLEPWHPFSISFWLYCPDDCQNGVLLHRQAGTDVGFHGTRVMLKNGFIRFEMTRFWPGNALAVQTPAKIKREQWQHVVITNDGSATASGLRIYVDGKSNSQVLRDRLLKDPEHRPAGYPGFVMGEQFRQIGFKHGRIDEVGFFSFALSPLEVIAVRDEVTELQINDHDRESLWQHRLAVAFDIATRSKVNEPAKNLLIARVPVTETMVMQELPSPRPAFVLHRGEYDAPRTQDKRAERMTPVALPPWPTDAPRNRLGLAQWLTAADHPLTARVAVNRIWQGFFGHGLVSTPNDFGYQSEMPVHSELLDWLARDFVQHGWDVKRLCKQIVLSETYRADSRRPAAVRNKDPENRLLARGPAHRLSAEMIRDLALLASGLLNRQLGGPPVSPYQPVNIWRENNTMTPSYVQSVGKDLYRRSLYTVWKRTTPIPNLAIFDATSREVCTMQRARTNTPQQAMVLLNDVQFVEAARVLAQRTLNAHRTDSPDSLIEEMFLRLAGRSPDAQENQILTELLSDQLTRFAADPQSAEKLTQLGESARSEHVNAVELAAVTVVAQAILNSDAAIWKR